MVLLVNPNLTAGNLLFKSIDTNVGRVVSRRNP
jgi:hypothetical protein